MKDGSVGHALAVVAVSLLTAGGVSAAVTGAKPNLNVQGAKLASAAQLPRWNIDEICASDSAGGQCRILEDQAYRTLSGGWYAVPDSFRDTCLATIKSPYDKSYRLLSQCLEGQVLVGLDKDAVKTAVVKDGKVRVAQAGGSNAAPVAAPSNGYPALPTSNVADLFKAREAWGAGAAKPVAAPLAAGAVSPLPADNAAVPKGFDGQPTVHALEATPVAQLTPVPQNQIADAMKKLLAERESWLKAPSSAAAAAPAAPAQAGGNGGSGYAVLPTTNVADLFKAREVWGTGTAKEVAAPLAAGAFSPLPADSVAVPKGFDGQPTVHPLEATPVAQLTAVPLDKIADAMKKLLAEREGWGKAPAGAATTAAPASAPAAAASTGGYAVLPTTNVADLFKARETWGTGTAKAVASPLAAGAFSPLPEDSVTVPKGFDGQPTVHPLEATPVAQLTAVPLDKIADAMKKLLAERESWGKAPAGAATAAAPASAPSSGASASGYPALPTSNVADLFKAREAWGSKTATTVTAPLALGAVSPLPSDNIKPRKGFEGQPTVHPLEATPVAQLTAVPLDKIADAMKKLLAEREGWGTSPSKAAKAASRSAEAADCEAKLRDAASKGVILFASDSDNLSSKSNATLDALAKIAKGCSKGHIRVEGHTDSTGRASYNKSLSDRRAKAVAAYLANAGVANDRLEAVGYGQEKPVASNNTREGRAQNRRIEFTVVE